MRLKLTLSSIFDDVILWSNPEILISGPFETATPPSGIPVAATEFVVDVDAQATDVAVFSGLE